MLQEFYNPEIQIFKMFLTKKGKCLLKTIENLTLFGPDRHHMTHDMKDFSVAAAQGKIRQVDGGTHLTSLLPPVYLNITILDSRHWVGLGWLLSPHRTLSSCCPLLLALPAAPDDSNSTPPEFSVKAVLNCK